MATNRSNSEKLASLATAWEVHAPDKSFGGMTLEQFKAKVKPSLDARSAEATAKDSRRSAALDRTTNDVESMKVHSRVINAIRGDEEFGDDSTLYQAAGYVPTSQKKSGLSRKAKAAVIQQKAA